MLRLEGGQAAELERRLAAAERQLSELGRERDATFEDLREARAKCSALAVAHEEPESVTQNVLYRSICGHL